MATLETENLSERRLSGPRILDRLPSMLHFSNNSGLTLNCMASGNPNPEVHWTTGDHLARLPDVPGLRQTLLDGQLRINPFQASEYEQRLHATGYRCVASNQFGTVRGKLIQTRGGKVGFFSL